MERRTSQVLAVETRWSYQDSGRCAGLHFARGHMLIGAEYSDVSQDSLRLGDLDFVLGYMMRLTRATCPVSSLVPDGEQRNSTIA